MCIATSSASSFSGREKLRAVFLLAGFAYLVALAIVHGLVPRLKAAEVQVAR